LLAVRPVAVNNDNKQQQAKRGRKIKDWFRRSLSNREIMIWSDLCCIVVLRLGRLGAVITNTRVIALIYIYMRRPPSFELLLRLTLE
jgi:hypothetical protein